MNYLKSMLLVLSVVIANTSMAQDSSKEKVQAAKRYMTVANLEAIWNSMVSEHAATLDEPERTKYLQSSQSKINIEKFEAVLLKGLVAVFTTEELNALADFYGSKAGQSAIAKYGKFSAYISPLISDIAITEMQVGGDE
ncbi:MAG: DUF2059 domain-containing protein [Pseudomonadales bacterium]|nr:DUF2059 domain-containing protein [Pseudomonadales bacterium]